MHIRPLGDIRDRIRTLGLGIRTLGLGIYHLGLNNYAFEFEMQIDALEIEMRWNFTCNEHLHEYTLYQEPIRVSLVDSWLYIL